ncbi:hypothetical protein SAMN05421640_3018 [Ekhidna lutea]|uniref:Uncharacterized protein n=1 Tax=Ekhidna lutea TaxID=447679 RepID=A0A239L8B3_EKHLU|nr:hypothetical protein SAMN05421640_3018 [Ekhidna lutea]
MINLIENQIIKSDEELLKISSLRNLYLKYFNQLEKLWSDFENKIMNENQASESFFALRSDIKEKIEELDNEVHVRQIPKLLEKTDREEKLYFNNRYG